jgi:Amt family ammonium transporter
MVWLVWFQCGSALAANGFTVQGTTTVCSRSGMALIFYDKILGHKVSAMGACIEQ